MALCQAASIPLLQPEEGERQMGAAARKPAVVKLLLTGFVQIGPNIFDRDGKSDFNGFLGFFALLHG